MGCPVRNMLFYSNLPVSNTRLENALGFGFVWVRLVRKVIGGPSRRVANISLGLGLGYVIRRFASKSCN